MRTSLLVLALLLSSSPSWAQPAPGIAGVIDGDRSAEGRFAGVAGAAEVQGGGRLAQGASGALTVAVQRALIDMGFAIEPWIGRYGQLTARAVTNFQTHARVAFPDVQVTGEVDAATLRALATLAPPAGQRGQRGNTPSNVCDGKRVRIVVVKAEHRTFVFDAEGRVTHVFLNAVGAPGSPTDSALKVVQGKLGKAIAAAMGKRLWGNSTVFGERIINLTGGGQELHGTSAPTQLGLDVSHGCVRHHNADIITLFNLARVGDEVAIVDRLDDPRLGPPAPVVTP